jgi:hypothetical protein
MADIVNVLNVLMNPAGDAPETNSSDPPPGDIDGDGRLGLEEMEYILQRMSEVR